MSLWGICCSFEMNPIFPIYLKQIFLLSQVVFPSRNGLPFGHKLCVMERRKDVNKEGGWVEIKTYSIWLWTPAVKTWLQISSRESFAAGSIAWHGWATVPVSLAILEVGEWLAFPIRGGDLLHPSREQWFRISRCGRSELPQNHLASCEPADSESVGLEWGLRILISNQLSGAAHTAGQ